MDPSEIVLALAPVVDAFAALDITYRIGGSVASSALGTPRSTIDADLVCNIDDRHVEDFVARLKDAYYVDAEMVRDAIRRRSSFNLVHLATMVKVDVFVQRRDAFGRISFERVVKRSLDTTSAREFDLTTAEDIILRKLEWYEEGARVSERQWSDVIGVIAVQREALDREYLARWAKELGLETLLEKALREGDAR